MGVTVSFVKALFGTVTTADFTLQEGKVGRTDYPELYKEMEARGIVKVFNTKDEADAFKFKPSLELFNESYLSLNPPLDKNGDPIQFPTPTLNFATSEPFIVNGVPTNYLPQEELVPASVPTPPSAPAPKVAPVPASTQQKMAAKSAAPTSPAPAPEQSPEST
jgi:hypothetical protein